LKKLNIVELNRLSNEAFKIADKLPVVVILDNIRSLHNVGSIFRTCDAFRIEKIYLCGLTNTPPHQEIHKTALGAEFSMEWTYCNNTLPLVISLQNSGYTVFSIEQAHGSSTLEQLLFDPTKKYAVIFGNEVKGVQQSVVDQSDGCIEIPQFGTKHSLNVSVAAGIIIWDLFSKLSKQADLL
jgi:23S rRNA (guanosine2251-2'-O)-methyltransferase